MSDFGAADFGAADEAKPNDGAAAVDVATPDALAERKKEQLAISLAYMKEKGWNNPIPFNYETVGTGGLPNDERTGDERTGDEPWLGNAAVYEWDDDYGEVGPRNDALEQQLFFGDEIMRAGNRILSLTFDVDCSGGQGRVFSVREFKDAGLHPVMLENVNLCRYTSPTPIQSYCIPAVLMGNDVVAIAQTGSGKTAAYLIPILSKLMGKARALAAPRPNPSRYNSSTDRVRAEPLVLIVCPTRELACQIFDEARRLCYRTMLRPCVIYGGAPTKDQRAQLEMGCDILVATPGRLMDFMANLNLLSLARLKFTVIDEADEMLSSGWEEVMEKIFSGSDTNADADHTYLMFSATFPKEARKLVRDYMADDFVKIKVGRVGSTHANITQSIVYVEEPLKDQALFDLIISEGPQRTLIFVNSKFKCDIVDDYLYNKGMPVTSIHSGRTQREREDALRSFRTARTPIMVATGVSARGLDVANIKHVINYDLPSTQHEGITEYVHRIGRTARIGNEGKATSFYNDRNDDLAPSLVKILIESKQAIPDFLEQFKPADPEKIFQHEDTDDEDSDDGGGAGGGFGDGGFGGGFDDDDGFGGGFGDAGAAAGAAAAAEDNGGFQESFTAAGDGDQAAAW